MTSWNQLRHKDPDTLYFIYDSPDSDNGVLYLGDKLISGGAVDFQEISGIDIANLHNGDLLVYNEAANAWTVKPPIQAVPIMTGATEESQGTAGLVPVPNAGANNLFLQGNGSWADPVPAILKKQVSDLVALDAEKSAREIAAEESAKVTQLLVPITNGLDNRVTELETKADTYISNTAFIAGVGNLKKMFNYNTEHNTIVDAVNELDTRLTWHKTI